MSVLSSTAFISRWMAKMSMAASGGKATKGSSRRIAAFAPQAPVSAMAMARPRVSATTVCALSVIHI